MLREAPIKLLNKKNVSQKPIFTDSVVRTLLENYTNTKTIVVISEKVLKLYPSLKSEFLKSKFTLLPFPDGEKVKTFKYQKKLINFLFEEKIDKSTTICAIGGGTLLDLSGFVSSILLRGLKWIAVPTTLLSMADASIGGKTAINTNYGKNLVGTFHFPIKTLIDINFLKTLPKNHLQNGLVECAKCGLVKDRTLFESSVNADLKDIEQLKKIVKKAQSVKLEVVKKDPFETKGQRYILNFGHTVGHSLERCFDYKILHGRAVLEGVLFESAFSFLQGFLKKEDFNTIKNSIVSFFPRIKTLPSIEKIFQGALSDKKNQDKKVRYVPIKEIGKVALKPPYLSEVDFKTFQKAFFLVE